MIACYVRVSDYQGVITIARSIWQRYQFQTDPLRLLQALVPGGFNAIKASHLNTLQKYSIRQINTVNRIVNGEVVKVKQLQPAIKAKITKAKTPKKKVVLEDDDQEMDHEDEEDGDCGDDDEAVEESRIDAFKPTKLNPVYIISHSCMLLSSKSYSPAISTFSCLLSNSGTKLTDSCFFF